MLTGMVCIRDKLWYASPHPLRASWEGGAVEGEQKGKCVGGGAAEIPFRYLFTSAPDALFASGFP